MSVILCRLWVLLKSSGECLFKQAINLVKFRLQVSYSLLWVKVPISVQLSKPMLWCSGPVLNMQHSWVHLRVGQWFTSQTSRQSCCCAASGKPKGLRWFIHKILGVTFSSSPFFPSPLTFQSTVSISQFVGPERWGFHQSFSYSEHSYKKKEAGKSRQFTALQVSFL